MEVMGVVVVVLRCVRVEGCGDNWELLLLLV